MSTTVTQKGKNGSSTEMLAESDQSSIGAPSLGDNFIIAHPYELIEKDELDPLTNQLKLVIKLYCLEHLTNRAFVITIHNYNPYCYVELPTKYFPKSQPKGTAFTASTAETLAREMTIRLKDRNSDEPLPIVSSEFVKRSKFFYYQPRRNTFDMLLLRFQSNADMKSAANRIENESKIPNGPERQRGIFYGPEFGRMALRAWEHTIPTARKLFNETGMNFSGWFRLKIPASLLVQAETATTTMKTPNRKITIIPTEAEESLFYVPEIRIVAPNPVSSSLTGGIVANPGWASVLEPISAEEEATLTPSSPSVLAYDIETYSDNHKALPDAENHKHTITMISCVYQRLRDPSTRKRYLLTIKSAGILTNPKHPIYVDSNTTVDEIIVAENEGEMLKNFANLVADKDPDILTGFNTPIYDNPYMNTRYSMMVDVLNKRWPQWMSRSKTEEVVLVNKQWRSSGTGIVDSSTFTMEGRLTIDLYSVVKKDYNLLKYTLDYVAKHFLKEGKHDVSAVEMFKAYEAVLETGRDVKCGLLDEKSEERRNARREMTRVAAYAIQDSELVVRLFEELTVWIGLLELSKVAQVTVSDVNGRGQQHRIISQIHKVTSAAGIVIDKRSIPKAKVFTPATVPTVNAGDSAATPAPKKNGFSRLDRNEELPEEFIPYTGGYVGQPIPGLHNNVLCMDFASLYPSLMMAYNICLSTFSVLHSLIEDRFYSGRLGVFDRRVAVSQKTIFSNSFAAVGVDKMKDARYAFPFDNPDNYHEIIFEQEVTDDGKVVGAGDDAADEDVGGGKKRKGDDEESGEDEQSEGDGEKSENDEQGERSELEVRKRIQVYKFYFVKKHVFQGILPMLVENLVSARGEVRRLAGQIKADLSSRLKSGEWTVDSPKAKSANLNLQILDKRQLAYKIIANSVYGFVGAQKGGAYSLVEGAMSITGKGRIHIGDVYNHIRNQYNGRIIGGDTDSCFFQLPEQILNSSDCAEWGHRLAAELTGLVPKPMKVEFEKAMLMLNLKKKNYAAMFIKKNGELDQEKGLVTRGIVLARRDRCKLLTDLYERVLRHIMNRGDVADALLMIGTELSHVLLAGYRGELSHEKFEIVKSLNTSYKSATNQMALFSKECNDSGYPVRPGDRLSYVVCKYPVRLPAVEEKIKLDHLGLKMRLLDAWLAVSPREEIDLAYYIEKMCKNPIDSLIRVAYGNELGNFPRQIIMNKSGHAYNWTQPVKFFQMMCNAVRGDLRKVLPALDRGLGVAVYKSEAILKKEADMAKKKADALAIKVAAGKAVAENEISEADRAVFAGVTAKASAEWTLEDMSRVITVSTEYMVETLRGTVYDRGQWEGTLSEYMEYRMRVKSEEKRVAEEKAAAREMTPKASVARKR